MTGAEKIPLHYAFHYASQYRDRGYSVIPLTGKVPAIAWGKYQHHPPPLSTIATWFGERSNQQYNVGIVTGRISNLVVVDLDDHDAETMWLREKPASPLMVRTGSGCLHVYYRQPVETVRNRVGVLGHKIDIRAEGGLVVAPPSKHPNTGKPLFLAVRWRRLLRGESTHLQSRVDRRTAESQVERTADAGPTEVRGTSISCPRCFLHFEDPRRIRATRSQFDVPRHVLSS